MAKANKKSLDAKTYINREVANMRERLKNCDEAVKGNLREILRKQISSDEYQKNLEIVHEDADWVREYAKRKKGGDITGKEFRGARKEFYGRDMEGALGKDFKKLKPGEKVNYIFENFGDTDYSADLIIDLLDSVEKEYSKMGLSIGTKVKKEQILNILGIDIDVGGVDDRFSGFIRFGYLQGRIEKKFGKGIVTVRLMSYIINEFYSHISDFGEAGLESLGYKDYKLTQDDFKNLINGNDVEKYLVSDLAKCLKNKSITDHEVLDAVIKLDKIPYDKISAEGIKYIIDKFVKEGKTRSLGEALRYTEDGSITDHEVLDAVIKLDEIPFSKISVEGTKYIVDECIKNGGYKDLFTVEKSRGVRDYGTNYLYEAMLESWHIKKAINLGENVDKEDYILKSIIKKHKDREELGYFLSRRMDELFEYHDKIADIFIENGDKDLLIENISKFTGLSKEKKAEIMGDVKAQDELKFKADLENFRKRGERLGFTIDVEENKKEEEPTTGGGLINNEGKNVMLNTNKDEILEMAGNLRKGMDAIESDTSLSEEEKVDKLKELFRSFSLGDTEKKPEAKRRRRFPRFRKGV